ncbi:hypothetical protein JF781_20905 [Mycobacterium sp. WUMAC-067]|uniref:PPE family protein n=1 Tax=unclassified Mycobacterium TaxID=2642494 RepID=UPI001CDA195F|nr:MULTISPECIES: PPE family protein [unclassified Mycobacterium]MCA2244819.1 hypothetical protein [Mycobacterium sp. WUMAC-067]MCA2316125.1 hypothetical protein [Mycobacterium sp. WUMAC-025]
MLPPEVNSARIYAALKSIDDYISEYTMIDDMVALHSKYSGHSCQRQRQPRRAPTPLLP